MQVLLTASKQIQDGTAEQTGSRLALTTAQAAPLLCQFMSAYVMHFLVSLFARAGSVVPGPVGLGLLLWPPGVGGHTAASDGSGGGGGGLLLGLAITPMKDKSCHHTHIISNRGNTPLM